VMYENTYVQNLGMKLGQYGANEAVEPPILPFDADVERTVAEVLGDTDAKVYIIE